MTRAIAIAVAVGLSISGRLAAPGASGRPPPPGLPPDGKSEDGGTYRSLAPPGLIVTGSVATPVPGRARIPDQATPPPRGAQEGGISRGLALPEAENAQTPAGPNRRWERQGPRSGLETDRVSNSPPPRVVQEGGNLLAELDRIEARIALLEAPSPDLCAAACLTGVESAEVKWGHTSCRCRRAPSLGWHPLPKEEP